MTGNDGLWLFVAVVCLNVIGLSCDEVLLKLGLPTVTDFCRRNVWLSAVIVGMNFAGTLGLWYHLTAKNGG